MKIDKVTIRFILFTTILVGATILLWDPLSRLLANIETIKYSIEHAGISASLAFIGLIILQVLFAPIPGQIVAIASGYLFGVWKGTLYMMIGSTIGSFIIFVLSRKLGRPFVEKILSKKAVKKVDKFVAKSGAFALFMMFLLPFFPDDAICYLAGLTKIKIRNLVLISILGRFPEYLVLAFIGAGFATQSKLSIVVFSAFSILLIVLYLKKDKLEEYIMSKNAKP